MLQPSALGSGCLPGLAVEVVGTTGGGVERILFTVPVGEVWVVALAQKPVS